MTQITRKADPQAQATIDPTLAEAIQIAWSYAMMAKKWAEIAEKYGQDAQNQLGQQAIQALLARIQALIGSLLAGAGSGGSGGGGSGGGGDAPPSIPIVTTNPGTCNAGELIWNSTQKKLFVCQGGQWVDIFTAFTPNAPAPVQIVNALPASGTEGQWVFNTADNKLYVWHNGAWITAQASLTPDATQAVAIVDALPGLPNTTYPPGAVILNRTDGKLYKNVADAWVLMTNVVTPNVPNAIALVSVLPPLPDTNYAPGIVVFNLGDKKLYQNVNDNWTVIAQQANITAGSITAGMIAAGAIGTTELAAGAVTTDKLAANSITAGKIAAGAVSTSQLAAGAVTADKMAVGSITAGMIAAGAIGTQQLAAGAITSDKLATNFLISGSANIAVASITTLSLDGNAVTVPVLYNSQSPIYGYGGTLTVAQISFNLPYAAYTKIDFSANQSYSGSVPDSTWILYLDGGIIAGTSSGGGQASVNLAGGGARWLQAGSHNAYVTWMGQSAAVAIGNINLSAIAAMR